MKRRNRQFYYKLLYISILCLFTLQVIAQNRPSCRNLLSADDKFGLNETVLHKNIKSGFSEAFLSKWHLDEHDFAKINQDPENHTASIDKFNFQKIKVIRPSIDLDFFSLQLISTVFKDNENKKFRLIQIKQKTNALILPLNIKHSEYGEIKNLGWDPDFFAGLYIRKDGIIDGRLLFIEWPALYQNKGFLSGIFKELGKLVEEKTEYWIYDASKTEDIDLQILKLPSLTLMEFIEKSELGSSLFQNYLTATQAHFFKNDIRTNINPYTDIDFQGFRRYLSDLITIHGRICRYGNFRSHFLDNKKYDVKIRIKINLPDSVIEKENELLSRADFLPQIYDLLQLN